MPADYSDTDKECSGDSDESEDEWEKMKCGMAEVGLTLEAKNG